jgi:hypothetical protein
MVRSQGRISLFEQDFKQIAEAAQMCPVKNDCASRIVGLASAGDDGVLSAFL